MRLLLVEDDRLLADNLARQLSKSGFVVDHVESVKNARALGGQENYRVVVLDIGLPDGDGLEALRYWRKQRNTMPVLILTARSAWQDKVNGLKAGADDYLAKPFQTEELVARLFALIRRSEGRIDTVITVGTYRLDEESQRVQTPDQHWHALTGTEFRMLRCLMSRSGRIFSKEELLEQLYTLADEPAANTIEAYVRRLRKLIGQDAILTLRGQGYVFNEDH